MTIKPVKVLGVLLAVICGYIFIQGINNESIFLIILGLSGALISLYFALTKED